MPEQKEKSEGVRKWEDFVRRHEDFFLALKKGIEKKERAKKLAAKKRASKKS